MGRSSRGLQWLKVVIAEGYTFGDEVLRLWTAGEKLTPAYGVEQRAEGEQVPLTDLIVPTPMGIAG
jgi:hypothetical protein